MTQNKNTNGKKLTSKQNAKKQYSEKNAGGRTDFTKSLTQGKSKRKLGRGTGRKPAQNSKDKAPLRVVPLGGLREVGKNMTCYEYENDMIIVDCSIAFPNEDMPGVDVIIPDFTYLRENREKIRAIFITHGHEDHIGAVPWLLSEFDVPLYGNRLTLKLIENKLKSRPVKVEKTDLRLLTSGQRAKAGCMQVEFIHVNHSIADANALAITTPAGVIVHTGDFKIDYTPLDGETIDLGRLAELGKSGVFLLASESTNVESPGTSTSEKVIAETLAKLFSRIKGRIFIATFASNVSRLRHIIHAAEENGRKVCLQGRSIINVYEAAKSIGYMDINENTIIDVNTVNNYRPEELLILTTGSQGETSAALSRLAFAEHKNLEIVEGDTVILSSSKIPGNEKAIYRVVNELFRRGAEVIYDSMDDIHASGHAYKEELKLMLALTKPKYFIPIHGEYRHLYKHASLAHDQGIPWENISLLANGDILELEDNKLRFRGFTEGAGVLIDGSGMGDVDELVLRDRLLLAEDGVVSVYIGVNTALNKLIGDIEIKARGFIYESEIANITEICRNAIEKAANEAVFAGKSLTGLLQSKKLEKQLKRVLFEHTSRRPVILISVLKV